MSKLLITLDEESSKVLVNKKNKSETVRNALKVYNEYILTDKVLKDLEQTADRLNKLAGELERRMW